jgi:hypothetical protein
VALSLRLRARGRTIARRTLRVARGRARITTMAIRRRTPLRATARLAVVTTTVGTAKTQQRLGTVRQLRRRPAG